MSFSQEIKKSIGGDEYYSPQNVVDMIVPYIKADKRFKKIWCPFDTEDSRFVQTFQKEGYEVEFGHISTGQDFFEIKEPLGDVVVSNPPFSKRDGIFERLFYFDVPFALVMNFNGLFDSKRRASLFRRNGVELIVPSGRMKFIHQGETEANHPNFQSVYVCNRILNRQAINYNRIEFFGEF